LRDQAKVDREIAASLQEISRREADRARTEIDEKGPAG
jgi:hypothetical protein